MAVTSPQPTEKDNAAKQDMALGLSGRLRVSARHPIADRFRLAPWSPAAMLRAALPALAVALVLLAGASVYYVRWGFANASWQGKQQAVPPLLAFNDIGRAFASRVGDAAEAVAPIGYDGQFFYFIARDPGIMQHCARTLRGCPIDANPLREERILYPATARVVALGNSDWLHLSLFLVNLVAILVTVVILGKLCVEAGGSRWLGAAVGMFCGEMLGLLRDLADPYAVMWMVVAIYLLRKNRPLWCAAAVAAAVLAREQFVVVLPLLFLPLLAQRRWRTLVAALGIALVPFAAWQMVLRLIFDRWAFMGTVATTHGVTYPFHGLLEYAGGPEFGVTVAFVAIPLLFTLAVTFVWLRRFGLAAVLADPIPLVALVYSILLTLTAYAEWEGMWNSARLVTPAAALGVLLVCQLAPGLRRSYSGVLAITALAPLFMLPALF